MVSNVFFPHRMVIFAAVAIIVLTTGSTLFAPVISRIAEPLSEGECEECHEGFEPFELTIDSPEEVPVDHEFEFKIRVENNWKHEIDRVLMFVDVSRHDGLMINSPWAESWEETVEGSVSRFSETSHDFEGYMIPPDVLTITLDGDDGRLGLNDIDLEVEDSIGNVWTSDGPDADESLVLESEVPFGGFIVRVIHIRGRSPISYTLSVEADYGYIENMDFGGCIWIGPGEEDEMTVTLRSVQKGVGTIDIDIEGQVSYEHKEGYRSETYYEEMEYEIVVGDELVYHPPRDKISSVEVMWMTGRWIGFLTAFLFFASFFTGGSINSWRKWLDERIKRRKELHCVIAFTSIVSAIVHMLILYSGMYGGTYKGLGLGLTATLMMLVLGITGIFRSRIAVKIGDKRWRRFHFWLSVAVIIIFVIHSVKEGTDLAFLRWW